MVAKIIFYPSFLIQLNATLGVVVVQVELGRAIIPDGSTTIILSPLKWEYLKPRSNVKELISLTMTDVGVMSDDKKSLGYTIYI